MGKTTKTCGICNTSKSFNQYYKSPIDGSFLPICKNCANKLYKNYIQILGSNSAALWLVLSQLGVPFISQVWSSVEPSITVATGNTDIVMLYLKGLNESGLVVDGFWNSDVMLDQLIETSVDREAEDNSLDLAKECSVWGKFLDEDGNLDVDSYVYLNKTFDEYTKDFLEMDANIQRRYRDLAKAELRKRQADESGDIQEIAKAQDNLKKILDMLKLSDFKSNIKTDEQLAFESRVSMIEYTKPSECEDLKKYVDMVGYEKDRAQCFRSLRNAIAETREYPDIPKEER